MNVNLIMSIHFKYYMQKMARFIVYVRALFTIYTLSLAEGACDAVLSLWALQVCCTDA